MSDLEAKRALNTGFGNAFARGFEMALTPVVFAGLGWLIDRAAGTGVLFTIGLLIFSMVGLFVRTWIGYDAEMRRHEAGRVWNRGRGTSA